MWLRSFQTGYFEWPLQQLLLIKSLSPRESFNQAIFGMSRMVYPSLRARDPLRFLPSFEQGSLLVFYVNEQVGNARRILCSPFQHARLPSVYQEKLICCSD